MPFALSRSRLMKGGVIRLKSACHQTRLLRDVGQIRPAQANTGKACCGQGICLSPAPCVRIVKQSAKQRVGDSVTRLGSGVAAQDRRACGVQITQCIQHLMTHGFVGIAQATGVKHVSTIDNNRVFQCATTAKPCARIASTSEERQNVRLSQSSRTKAPLDMFNVFS